jgi:hypothetical protein
MTFWLNVFDDMKIKVVVTPCLSKTTYGKFVIVVTEEVHN